jgi:hypothetical protein
MNSRFTNDGTHDHSPVCAEGNHPCDETKPCRAGIRGCDGKRFCTQHLWRCDGCERAYCIADAVRFLEGGLCDACLERDLESITRRHQERVEEFERLAEQVRRRA